MIFSWKGPFRTISSPTLLWQAWGISTIISGCTKPHPISFWMDFRMEFLGSTTSLCQCLITRSFVLMSNAVHDFTGQWGEAERSVVSRVLVIELFKDGCCFPFLQSLGMLTAVTSQKWWRVAWQLQLQNFLRTLGFMSLGSMDLHMSRFLWQSWIWSSLIIGGTSFLQSLPHLI